MYVVGTAGHVDHGKSLLVERMTGIDPDRLGEEKARGMTIDLGFAWLTLPSARPVSIVDVPGHERFIKNMLAGAGGIDLALLVIAADDGVMPQTREHLAILDLLGVRRGVVALSKCDLVEDDWRALVEADVAAALAGTFLEGAPIIRVSSVTGEGLDDLQRALDAALDGLPPKRDIGRPRLPIDRVFTIGGFGTVVTGTLVDGALTPGMELEAVPGGPRGRVRALQSHREQVERALPGMRTAVNLSGVPRDALRRGMVLAPPGEIAPATVVDARLRAVEGARALRHNMRVTFHCLADEAGARLRLLDVDELSGGGQAWAQVKLDGPVAAVRGDRFILRTATETVAGGTIVDVAPARHRRHHAPTIDALAARATDSPEAVLAGAVEARRVCDLATLRAAASLGRDEFEAALARLVGEQRVATFGEGDSALVAADGYVEERGARAREALAAYHAAYPLRAGMPVEELRARLGLDARALAALAPVWPDVRIAGATAALSDFRPELTPAQRAAAEAFVARLAAAGAHPPAPDGIEPAVLAYLAETGAVVDAGDGVLFAAGVFDEMTATVRRHIESTGAITLAQARDLLGTSRRQAQAFLEHLDRLRITRRVGEARILRQAPSAVGGPESAQRSG